MRALGRLLLALLMLAAVPAAAQIVVPAGDAPAAPALPEDFPDTPEGIDRLLGGLTDAEIRAVLREELVRGAEDRAALAEAAEAVPSAEEQVLAMLQRIATRLDRWRGDLANISDRLPEVEARIDRSRNGVLGMLLASALIVVAGFGAAFVVAALTRGWRRSLANPEHRADYLERLIRSIVLGATELLTVAAFLIGTQAAAAAIAGPMAEAEPGYGVLGPLDAYVWIYHSGISAGWSILIVARRILSPDTRKIAISPLPEAAVRALYATVRVAAFIGVFAWLCAGLSPTLGFGFAPAMVLVATSGILAGSLLIWRVVANRNYIRETILQTLSMGRPTSSGVDLVARAAPAVMVAYLVVALVYWLAHWLARGQHELLGPAGTLAILLMLPAFDGAGTELARGITGPTERGQRYCRVLIGTWRTVLMLGVVVAVLLFWGVDVAMLAADPVVSPLIQVVAAFIAARLAWQLINATFYLSPRATGHDAEEEAIEESSETTRLRTLVPLFRAALLIVVGTVTVMVSLASVGVDIGPLLASAGIIGIAIGFGAQTLVRDIFSGAFFLIDDAFRVGEYIEIDTEIRGEVEGISIRSLRLRHHLGPVLTIPFGELKYVKNHNRDWVIYKMEFRMEPETDPQKVKKVVKEVGKQMLDHPEHGPKFLEPLKSQGVLMIDEDSALVIRVKFTAKPRTQFVLRREIYHALRKAFFENDIRLARRKVEVVSQGAEGAEAAAAEAVEQAAVPAARPM